MIDLRYVERRVTVDTFGDEVITTKMVKVLQMRHIKYVEDIYDLASKETVWLEWEDVRTEEENS